MNNKFKVLSSAILISTIANANDMYIAGGFGANYNFEATYDYKQINAVTDTAAPAGTDTATETTGTATETTETATDTTETATDTATKVPTLFPVLADGLVNVIGNVQFAKYFDELAVIVNSNIAYRKPSELKTKDKKDAGHSTDIFKFEDKSNLNVIGEIMIGYEVLNFENATLLIAAGIHANYEIQSATLTVKAGKALNKEGESVNVDANTFNPKNANQLKAGLSAALIGKYMISEDFGFMAQVNYRHTFANNLIKVTDDNSSKFEDAGLHMASFSVNGLYSF